MAKVKTTAKFSILNLIDKIVDGSFNDRLGRKIATEAKELIASGQSPVRGHGRFQGYSESYKTAIKDKNVGQNSKTVRPVNLNLSGKMLEHYGHESDAKSIWVGVTGGPHAELAEYHNEGTDNMPARRIVPIKGEEYSARIMRLIRDEYGKRLTDFIKRSNTKD